MTFEETIPPTLLTLLQHYSPSGKESKAVSHCVERMHALGFTQAFVDEAGNAVGIMGQGERQIILLGHIDTVEGEIELRVEGPPKKLWIFGRGAVDAKGPLAAFIDAVATVGEIPGWQLVVIGAVDEERDSRGARHITPRYQPTYAIVGEPSRWDRVTLGYKGSAWANITVTRPLAHTASQQKSACEAAFLLWGKLSHWVEIYNSDHERPFEQILITLRELSSGEDGFEEWARLRIGCRLPLDIHPNAWYQHLQDTCQASIKPLGFPIPAYKADKNTPLVRTFLKSIRQAGGKPGFVVKTGTADLNIVAPVWNCPILAYGPGDAALDHTPDEHLSIQEYTLSVNILHNVLKYLCTR